MAEPKGQPARLQDILNYDVDAYFNHMELRLIREVFKNPMVIDVIRKAMLPSVGDPKLPIEELGSDVWLMGRDYGSIPEHEIKSIVVARQEAIKFVMGGLIKLKVMANSKEETESARAARQEKDSVK